MYKFIFVDDEDIIRELFQELLDYAEYGFSLEEMFSSAEEAYAYLEHHPDISAVITDIRMGVQSGIDFCEKMREINQNILLVIMSGYKEFEYAQRAISCDVFEYLLKPTSYHDLDKLFRKMKRYLDEKQPKAEPELETEYISLLDTAKHYIKQNYAGNLSLDMVAEHVGMNAAYFSRFFKKHMGMNFLEYLTKVRMDAAKELLSDPRLKVYEICTEVGYTSLQHFLKLFKQYTGVTPSEFRDKKCGIKKES